MTSEPSAPAPDDQDPARAADVARPSAPAPDEDERRLHPAYVVARIVSTLRNLIPAILAFAIGGEWGWWVILGLAVLVPTVMVLEWRSTRYAVVDGALRLRSGVFNRSERVIPASRISALDTSRGLVQRLFGLVSLEVQTPGGGKKAELRLEALRFDEAERLRRLLGHADDGRGPAAGTLADVLASREPTADRPDGATAAPGTAASPAGRGWGDRPADARGWGDPPPDARGWDAPPSDLRGRAPAGTAQPVYALTPRDLVVAAVTGPQLGLAAVAVASAASQFSDVLPDGVAGRVDDTVSSATITTFLFLLLAGLAVIVVGSVIGTVLAFSGFTVLRDDRRLRVRRGLFTERTGTIPLDRVHGVRIVEGLLRRPLGYATVQVEVAGYRGDSDVTRTLVPLVRRRELPALLARVLPEIPWPAGELERPPARARRRFGSVPLFLSLAPAVAAVLLLPDAWRLWALAPLAAAALLGEARWRAAGWRLDPETMAARRHHVLARTTLLLLPRRAQRIRVRTTPFARRAGLATFSVVLATRRRGTAALLEAATADALQRAVTARTARGPRAAARDDLSLDFAAAPPE